MATNARREEVRQHFKSLDGVVIREAADIFMDLQAIVDWLSSNSITDICFGKYATALTNARREEVRQRLRSLDGVDIQVQQSVDAVMFAAICLCGVIAVIVPLYTEYNGHHCRYRTCGRKTIVHMLV